MQTCLIIWIIEILHVNSLSKFDFLDSSIKIYLECIIEYFLIKIFNCQALAKQICNFQELPSDTAYTDILDF